VAQKNLFNLIQTEKEMTKMSTEKEVPERIAVEDMINITTRAQSNEYDVKL